MPGEGRPVSVLLLFSFYCIVCTSSSGDCNAANGVASWMGDGSCDPQNLISDCNWDGGDCCSCTCEDDDYVCGTGGYVCPDPSPVDDDEFTCEEESLPACSVEDPTPFIVATSADAKILASMVKCGGGNFELEWNGSIVVDTEIVVSSGTVLSITGLGPEAIVDGAKKTRLFRVVNGSLTLNDVEVRNGNATFGGAVAAINSNLTVHRTSFINNTAYVKNGGAVFLYGSSISFSGQTDFLNNSAENGGAVYAASNSSITWEGSSNFTGNRAYHSGGALAVVVDSEVIWEAETTFEENTATTYRGGALFLEDGSSASWEDRAAFAANHALLEGGAIFIDTESNASWSAGAKFSGNSVQFAGGGAIHIGYTSMVHFHKEASFEFNSAASHGGAVSSVEGFSGVSTSSGKHESLLWFNDSTKFANNTCKNNGGGLALLGGLHVSFGSSDVIFSGNEAGDSGGGIYISSSSGNSVYFKSKVVFVENEAGFSGGGVYVLATGVGSIFMNAAFHSNFAGVAGGGVYVLATGVGSIFMNAAFHSNFAKVGGGVFVSESASGTTFYGCRFIDNRATTTGGAMEVEIGSAAINKTLFKGNRAESAGALRVSGPVSFESCTFKENLAEVNGAPAISLTSILNALDMKTCVFSDNSLDCPFGTFLDETGSGDRFDFVCSGCGNCTSCTIENSWKVPTCLDELDHTRSPGGHLATIETLLVDPGYWRASNESSRILPCYNEEACLGGLTDSTEFCQEGYTGPYCAVCTENYVKGPGFRCIKCSDNLWGITAAAVVMVIAMAGAFTVFTFLASAETAGAGSGIVARLLRRLPLQSVKIIIVVWQIVTQFTTATGLAYPGLYQRILNAVSILNFDLSWMLSATCVVNVNFHGQLLVVTIGPIVVMLFLSGTYAYVKSTYCGAKEALEKLRNKYTSMVLFVMFLVYSSVSSVIFQVFGCEDLDDGKTYLRVDYAIECDKPRHRAITMYSSFMILLYPLGIPAFFAYLLFRDRKVLMDGASREGVLSVRPISGLWKSYRPSRFYFEVIECGRRIVLTGVVFIIYAESAAQISITLMLVFVFTVVSESLAPYISQWDTWVSRLGHAMVFCSVYYALLLRVEVSKETQASQRMFEVVLVITHVMMIVLVVCEALLTGGSLLKDQADDSRRRSNRHLAQRVRNTSDSLRPRYLRAVVPLQIEPAPLTGDPT